MKIFLSSSIKNLDNYTIEHEQISSLQLMERSATALTTTISQKWDKSTHIYVFAGPGNNGGDALAVARLLADKQYTVTAYLFNTRERLSPECEANRDRLASSSLVDFHEITKNFEKPEITDEDLIIDGLFGSGLKEPLSPTEDRGFIYLIKFLNSTGAMIVSIDLPSGLLSEDNTNNSKQNIIKADVTLSLQLPKLSFFFAESEPFLGKWNLLNINLSKEAIEEEYTNFEVLEKSDIDYLIRPRSFFAHKGNFGHALLIAGSEGMAGASVLSAKACMRSGVGLLTVHAPECNREILQVAVPEAMIEKDTYESYFGTPMATRKYQAIGIGPGLGNYEATENAVLEVIDNSQIPLVIDADALNILSQHNQTLLHLPDGTILTPHPKELDRLVGESSSSYERLAKAMTLAGKANVYIVLKGAYSTIITPDGRCFFNPTGNPGMATAGSGDVLTGVILALLAQGYSSEDAAKIGTYVHGLAGNYAMHELGEIAMTAGDIIDNLPKAWNFLANNG